MKEIKEKLEQIRDKAERASRSSSRGSRGWDGAFEVIIDMAQEALALIEEMEKTGVWVEIPPLLKDGRCDGDCPMLNICKWNLLDIEGYYPVHEGCPNFKREPIIKDCNRNQCNNLCYLWRLCNGHVAGQVFCPYFKGEEE